MTENLIFRVYLAISGSLAENVKANNKKRNKDHSFHNTVLLKTKQR